MAATNIGSRQIKDGGVATADLADNAVTYAKMQATSATDVVLGRSSSGGGTVEEIPCTSQARSLLDDTTAAAMRATLGLGPNATPTAGQILIGITGGSSFAVRTLTAGTNVTIDVDGDNVTVAATGGASGWGLAGNSGLDSSSFLGTTDAVDVVVKAGGVEVARFAHSNGYLGLGVSPSGKIHTYEATNNASTWIMQSLMGYGNSNASQTISMRAISGNTEMGYIQLRSVDPADSGYPGTTALVFAARNSATLRALLAVDGHTDKVKVTDPTDATRYGAFAMGAAFTISTSSGPITLASPIVASGGSVQVTGSTNPSSGVGLELHGASDRGLVLAYDRDGNVYKQLRFDGLEIALYNSGSAVASAGFLKTDASGVVSPGGYTPYDGGNLDTDVGGLGYLKTVAASGVGYTPSASGDWASSAPTTIAGAIDRIAAALATLLGTPIP